MANAGQAFGKGQATRNTAAAFKSIVTYMRNALLKYQLHRRIGIPGSCRMNHTIFDDISVIPHSTGAGNGQNAIAIDAPGQILAAAARSNRAGSLKVDRGIKQRFIIARNLDLIPSSLTSRVIHVRQLSTAAERLLLDFRHPPRDRHTGQAAARRKGTITNARYAVRYRHTGQTAAEFKRTRVNICHALRDRHAGQISAAGKSISPNFRYTLGHYIGSALLSCRVAKQKRVILTEQNVVHRIVGCISVHNNAAQAAALRKSGTADLLYACRNRHTGQAFTAHKSAPSNACQIIGQSQAARKTVAIKERCSVDARQAFRKHQTARKTMTIFKSASADTGQAFRKR